MAVGVSSMGLIFGREIAPAGGTFLAVGKVHSVSAPAGVTDEIDVTSFDSASEFEQVVSGIRRTGSATIELHFDPNDAQHQQLSDDFIAGDTNAREWRITWPDTGATILSFQGWVSAYAPSASVGGALACSVTIRCTGLINYDDTP